MRKLNEIVLEDVREDGQWWSVIRKQLKTSLPALYTTSTSPDRDGYDIMLSGIQATLGQAIDIANYLYFEGEYNESAWKDMITLFYVDSMRVIRNTVMRVHLFIGDRDAYDITDPDDLRQMQAAYLGYFNIRPVYGDRRCVSYVMLNYDVFRLSWRVPGGPRVPFDICTYRRNVHLGAAELHIHTFPYFGRDDKLVVCAQADMLMLSRYIYRKLGMPELTLRHICQNRSRDRLDIVPTRGITDTQMMDVFYEREISIRDYRGVDRSHAIQTGLHTLHAMGNMVAAMLDSGLPVLILIERHVVIANGISGKVYSTNWKDYPRRLTIYDDSGALLRRLERGHLPDIPFLGTYAWDEIITGMTALRQLSRADEPPTAPRRDDMTVIVPCYKDVTMDYFRFVETIKANIKLLSGLLGQKVDGQYGFDSARWNNTRAFLIECAALKKQLARICADAWAWMLQTADDPDMAPEEREDIATVVELQRALYERIMTAGLPHYYWCLEIPGTITDAPRTDSDVYMYYLFDAAPVVPTDIEAVCMNYIRKGDRLWRRMLDLGIDKARLRGFFAKYKTEVIVQPFSLRQRIEGNR